MGSRPLFRRLVGKHNIKFYQKVKAPCLTIAWCIAMAQATTANGTT